MDNKYRRTGLTGSPHFNVKTERTKNPFYLKHGAIQTVVETVNEGTSEQYESKYYIGTGYLPMRRYQSLLLGSSVSISEAFLTGTALDPFFDQVEVDGKTLVDFLVEKGLSENLNTSDVTSFVFGKNIIEPFSAVEQLAFHLRSGLQDNFNANDIVFVEVGIFKTFADEANATEEARWNFFKTLADDAQILDLVGIPDGSTFQFIKSLGDEAITSESLVRTWVAFREFNDPANVSEAKVLDLSKPFGETATITQTLQKAWSLFSPFVDAATITHDTIALVYSAGRSITDSLNSSDVQHLQITKVLEELANPSEELIWDLNKVFNDLADALDSPPDFTINKIFADIATAQDLIGVPDGATFQFIKTIASVADTLTTTDVLERQFTAFRTFGDAPTANDFAAILFATAFDHAADATDLTAINLSRPLSDVVDTNEFAAVFQSYVRNFTDSAALFHPLININMAKAIADGISVSDLLDDHFDIFVAKIIADQATITDLPLLNIAKPLSEELNLTELVQNLVGKIFGHSAGVEEHDFHRLLTNKVIADELNPAEANTLLTNKPLAHNVTLSEAISLIRFRLRELADSFSTGENALLHATKRFADTANAQDLLGVPDGSTFQFIKSVSESGLDVLDALLVSLGKELAEEATLSEEHLFSLAKPLQETASAIQQATISFETAFADQADFFHPPAQKFIGKPVSEQVDFSDPDRLFNMNKGLAHSATPADLLAQSVAKPVADTLSFSEAIAQHFGKPLSDIQNITEFFALAYSIGIPLASSAAVTNNDVLNIIAFAKNISDGVTMQDLLGVPDGITYSMIQSLADQVAMGDPIAIGLQKPFADTATFLESLANHLNLVKGDPATANDEDPTLDTNQVKSEFVLANQANVLAVSKILTDQAAFFHPPARLFTTKFIKASAAKPSTVEAEDFDGFDLDFTFGLKFNDVTGNEPIKDVIDRKDIGKVISDIFSAIQQHSFNMTKLFGHSTTPSDSPAIATSLVPFVGDNSIEPTDVVPDVHPNKGFFDTQTISEAIARKVLSKFISDIANIQDLVGIPDGITFEFITALSHTTTATDAINLISQHWVRNLADSAGVEEHDFHRLFTNKVTADLVTLNEDISGQTSKVFSHGVTIAEGSAFGVGKSLTESQSLTDALVSTLGFGRNFGDNATPGDSPALATSTSFGHSATPGDAPALNPSKVFGHGVTIAEGSVTTTGKVIADSTTPGDAINSILRTLVYGFADSTTPSENAILNSNKILAHSATPSDSPAKATSTSFGHSATPGDSPAFGTSLPFGHGVTATFTNSINTTKGLAHSTTPSDSPVKATSTSFGHSTTPGDNSPLLSIGIPLADAANALDLVGVPDGITYQWSTSFADQITSTENAAKAFSTGRADTASTSEAGKLIQRDYFASDYVEFDLSDPLAAYDAALTRSF